jgi:hypothetical protein
MFDPNRQAEANRLGVSRVSSNLNVKMLERQQVNVAKAKATGMDGSG